MLKLVFGLLAIILGGCVWTDREYLDYSRLESRLEFDAKNAETQCKLLARNMVQISRCEIRR
jgi:hypothetical protein